MKHGPVTKIEKGKTATSKYFDGDVVSVNFHVIVFIPIYGQFAAIWKPDSGCTVYDTYIFSNSNILSYRT